MRALLVILFLLYIGIKGSSYAQLVTIPGNSAPSLVQNVLLGPGVTVSNIVYNGSPSAISEFNATGTNLGISSGIVMTTGTVYNNGAGPQGPNNQKNSGIDNNTGGSGLLSGIIGGTQTYNAATLEFDFVPYSDTVRFKYVFGSEEYPEFAPPNNSSYNDVFGFFISGPGIAGIQNIAKLPNGAVVSINNVNQTTNSTYFNNNGDGSTAPQNSSPYYIQYDGFTDVLEASSQVQCGQTYHLILAVADVGDGIYDSGIFLEANSLSSNTPVDITHQLSEIAFPSDPNEMAEGCVSALITLERATNNLSSSLTIPVQVSGTASEGVDYTMLPNSVTFAAGQTIATLSLSAFSDILVEGQETIIIDFPITDPCGNVTPLTVELSIGDILPVNVEVQNGSVLCPGDDLELIAVASGGVGPYTYLWSTGETTSSIFVSPASSQTFTVSATDNCLHQTANSSSTVNVPVYPPILINESADITEICPFVPSQLESDVSGGAGNYTFQWMDNSGNLLGNLNSQIVKPSITTTYTIVVTDQCGIQQSADIIYTITSPPLIISVSPDAEICPGDSILLAASATGGYGQYYYEWSNLGETTASIWVQPTQTTSYSVVVSDECQTFTEQGNVTITVVRPTANFIISSQTLFDDLPITFQNTTINGVSYLWSFGDGNNSTLTHPNNIYADPGTYLVTLIATDIKGCKDTISKPIKIEEAYYVYVPNTFTPDGFRYNNVFMASNVGVQSMSVSIYDRWGELVYASNERNFQWDGTHHGKPVQDGTYIWKISYRSNSGKDVLLTGHINCVR